MTGVMGLGKEDGMSLQCVFCGHSSHYEASYTVFANLKVYYILLVQYILCSNIQLFCGYNSKNWQN